MNYEKKNLNTKLVINYATTQFVTFCQFFACACAFFASIFIYMYISKLIKKNKILFNIIFVIRRYQHLSKLGKDIGFAGNTHLQ